MRKGRGMRDGSGEGCKFFAVDGISDSSLVEKGNLLNEFISQFGDALYLNLYQYIYYHTQRVQRHYLKKYYSSRGREKMVHPLVYFIEHNKHDLMDIMLSLYAMRMVADSVPEEGKESGNVGFFNYYSYNSHRLPMEMIEPHFERITQGMKAILHHYNSKKPSSVTVPMWTNLKMKPYHEGVVYDDQWVIQFTQKLVNEFVRVQKKQD